MALTPGVWYGNIVTQNIFAASQTPPVQQQYAGLGSVTAAWTGACVNQAGREMLLVANGGGDDYWGNEVYGLQLGDSNPRWFRLLNCTPGLSDSSANESTYSDGRARSVHGWNRCVFANNRAWYHGMDAVAFTDDGTRGIMSFNRNYAGLAGSADDSPLAYLGGPGPWTYHGEVSTSAPWNVGNSVYDSVNDVIWSTAGNTNNSAVIGFDAQTASQGASISGNWGYLRRTFMVFSPSLKMVIGAHQQVGNTSTVFVMDVSNPSAPVGAIQSTTGMPSSLHGYSVEGWGGVHHDTANKIYVCDPEETGGLIYILNPSTWRWSTYSPPGGDTPSASDPRYSGGTGTKFNIVQDMGNGEACLVVVTKTNSEASSSAATWVMRVPAGGL